MKLTHPSNVLDGFSFGYPIATPDEPIPRRFARDGLTQGVEHGKIHSLVPR